MTGIALGNINVPKIALGNTEIARVSLGTIDVWPPSTTVGEFTVGATVFPGLSAQLGFNGPANFNAFQIQPFASVGVGTIDSNTHPFSWSPDFVQAPMFVLATVESPPSNGALPLTFQANGAAHTPGTWVQINPTSNSFQIFFRTSPNVGQLSVSRTRIQISSAPNGGNIIYDAVSEITVARTP